uniref:vWA domain-containing protein n=1 Tax=Yoonia sp. TaxID=2212373 RepID=UPI00404864B9
MTRDLDDLKSAMTAATPDPDATRKRDNIALAQQNFAALQGSANAARPTSENGPNALWTGVKTMLNTLTTKGGLSATTALVAVGFLYLSPIGQDLMRTGPDLTIAETDIAAKTAPLAPKVRTELPSAIAETTARTQAPAGLSLAAPDIDHAEMAAPMPADLEILTLNNTESFANMAANPVKITSQDPVSTFSIDVDTASYAVVRSSLQNGALPPRDAVRIEEMINYFPYDYAGPEAGEAPFRPGVSLMPTPWNAGTQLLHIAVQGRMPAVADRPPLNLVFLIDTSGSMAQPNKLPLLKQSFRLMLDNLRPQDQVAIVEYAGSAGQVLAPTSASERSTILQAIQSLGAGGSTNGQGGLQQAYAVAASMAEDGEVSRILLATDGDFNVGINSPDALTTYIADQRDSGTYLSVLGFGRGNLNDATMQALAQNGNGIAAYIDTLSEAQKVLVDQLTGALFPIAGDVKVQVEFNPATIAEYRLIGYETRSLRREDFNNDAVDAGDLGAGHNVTAIYEITPVGSAAQLNDPLRYAPPEGVQNNTELGVLKLRYKDPGADVSQLIELPISGAETADSEARFAAAIAGFGQLLRGSNYLGDWGYAQAIDLANANRGADDFGYRTQAVQLMRLAQSLADK